MEVQEDVAPVQVLVCVEALCIDSKNFFRDQLMIAFNALGQDVMHLTVVPFGNAKIDSSSHNITCQHGFGECDTNAYEQCAVHLYPDPAQHVPYLSCLFNSLPMGHRDQPFEQWTGLEPCAHDNQLDFATIKKCHDDPNLSWQLQTKAAEATPKRHDHVPWVEINGQYMNEDSHHLLKEVCKAYQQAGGHNAACSKLTP
ncbi:GILT-like protein [Seminavis robusta]|uniref:GILT-like protein n=1 Tax=Seminavis robusta TaxID=568900 RepID=A0A9N8HRI8_9STRA|nr:GILT-like protein [Seminavis robusta]|eukprot:Sro1276_g258570.1 GILT-like protein (199) ;mRNA; f:12533-13129